MIQENTLPSGLVRTYNKSEVIFCQGEPGNEMYIVYSGKVGLYLEEASGQRKLLATMVAGDFFGEMALVDDSPRSTTGIVEEDATKLLVLDRQKFIYLLRNQPDFALILMGKLCSQLKAANIMISKNKK